MPTSEFNIGVYSAPEAARMVGMEARTIRRWLLGYNYHVHGESRFQPALWMPQYTPDADDLLLGFRDVVEARIVNALLSKGIGLRTIRTCLERARALIGDDRPLSTRLFKTDGRTIFLEITEGVREPQLIDLKQRQGVFRRVIEPSLSGLEFGTDAAERWWLLDGKQTIVADPAFSFGQPTVAGHGIATARIAQAVRAEGSVAKVARLFDLGQRLVRDALKFEHDGRLPRAA